MACDVMRWWCAAQFKRQLPPKKEVNIQIVSACFKREIRVAFEEVKKVLFHMNKKKIMDEVRKIREQQKQRVRDMMAAQKKGACSCCCAGNKSSGSSNQS